MGQHVKEEATVDEYDIDSLSLSGGGAIGSCYPGVYRALVYSGLFKRLKNVAGSSAGSFTAAMLACGIPPLKIRNSLMQNGIETLLGDLIYEPDSFSLLIPRTGIPLYNFIREQLYQSVCPLAHDSNLSSELRASLLDPTYEITFRDLDELHQLYPARFKCLTVTATRKDTGELVYFDAESSPNVSVAKACQASCSIPGVLDKVLIDGVEYVDGGLRNNLPVEKFDKKKTLSISFSGDSSGNPVFHALYGSRKNEIANEARFDALLSKIVSQCIHKKIHQPVSEDVLSALVEQTMISFFTKTLHRAPTKEEKMQLHELRDELVKLLASNEHEFTHENHDLITMLIKEEIDPVFYHVKPAALYQAPKQLYFPNFIEALFRDWLIPKYVPNHGGTNVELVENTMRKIFSEYPLRCMNIRSAAHVSTLDFKKANQFYRPLNAIGFLDGLTYILNHELEDPRECNAKQFYEDFVHHFMTIYKATLIAEGKSLEHDKLLKSLRGQSTQARYHLIRDSLEIKLSFPWYLFYSSTDYALDSSQAFALTRAFEYTHDIISKEVLFKEIKTRKPQDWFGGQSFEKQKHLIQKELDALTVKEEANMSLKRLPPAQ